MLDEGRIFLVGHEDGQLVMWSSETGRSILIGKFDGAIRSIAVSPAREIAVGCESGFLAVFNLQDPKVKKVLQESTSSVFSRVWRVTWLNKSSLIATSTYGSMKLWTRDKFERWASSRIEGHSNSIFGLSMSNDLVASGDYIGVVQIFRYGNNTRPTLITRFS
jgi:WD40 repeat protein